MLSNKPTNKYCSKNYNLPKQRHKTKQVYLLVGMGHRALAWESTSLRNGELWLNGGMEEREGEWLERKMVSRHSHGHHNDRE